MSTKNLPKVAPHDACVACFRGDTDTCFGFRGSLEAHAALHMILGIPQEEAEASAIYAYELAGANLDSHLTSVYLVCAECAARGKLPGLSPAKQGAEIRVNTLPSDPEPAR
jgi:hypothetical protein